MNKKIKILTVCNQGNCRSVGTRRQLNKRGYANVIAIGCTNTSVETLTMLCDWADEILVAKPKHEGPLPKNARGKVNKQFTIGEDKWHNSMNEELRNIVKKQLDLIGFK